MLRQASLIWVLRVGEWRYDFEGVNEAGEIGEDATVSGQMCPRLAKYSS